MFMLCRCLQDSLKLNLCFCSHSPCCLEEGSVRKGVQKYLYFAILNGGQPLFLLETPSFPGFCDFTVLRFCSHLFLLYDTSKFPSGCGARLPAHLSLYFTQRALIHSCDINYLCSLTSKFIFPSKISP